MSEPSRIVVRPVSPRTHDELVREGLHPVHARVCAARGIHRRGELDDSLTGLIPPPQLLNADRAAAPVDAARGADAGEHRVQAFAHQLVVGARRYRAHDDAARLAHASQASSGFRARQK